MRSRIRSVGAVLALFGALAIAPAAAAGGNVGVVYTSTNAASGNAVLAYARSSSGALQLLDSVSTGGLGSGGGLGSQGAVVLSEDARWLLAVNAGSNEISSFAVREKGRLVLADRVWSGGAHPISVTVSRHLVYVVNDGGSGGIAGFRIDGRGSLTPITGSIKPLSSSASGPAQISFTPDGTTLVVTEKATNRITTYAVGANGAAGDPTSVASAGETPFGFAFDNIGHAIVSEAFGGAPGASAVSSYGFGGGQASLLDGPVPTTETAACWVVVTNNGKIAFASNTGSGTISGYAVSRNGRLTLLDADGVTGVTGGAPSDMALSGNSKFLYVRVGIALQAFAVGHDGHLSNLGSIGSVAGIVGLAAR